MATLTARLRATAMLGWRALLAYPFAWLVRGRGGPRRFLAQYAPDGLAPLPPDDAARLPGFMRCIGCGACDLVCPLVGQAGAEAFRGPSLVALSWTRSSADLAAAAPTLRRLPAACGSCRACEAACPRQVPLRALFESANRRLRMLTASPERGGA